MTKARTTRPFLFALLALATVAAPAWAQRERMGCARDRDRDDDYERFCEERALGWRATGRVEVDASPNGGVAATGWDRDSVAVIAVVRTRARTEAAARELAAEVEISSRGGVLRASGPAHRRSEQWWVSFELQVPARSDLTLATVNGPLYVAGVAGAIQLDAQNGPVTLESVGGDVRARVRNGPLRVTLAGSSWEGRGLDAETMNGPAVLRVPENYNAELEVGTVNGPMDLRFPVTVQGRLGPGRRDRLRTTLGRGGPLVRVVSTNGPATIDRAR